MFSEIPARETILHDAHLERLLAKLLSYGTWLASAVMASGLALGSGSPGDQLMRAGVALLILLPVSRVIVMLVVFIRHKEYRLVIAAVLVLAAIVAGMAIGRLT